MILRSGEGGRYVDGTMTTLCRSAYTSPDTCFDGHNMVHRPLPQTHVAVRSNRQVMLDETIILSTLIIGYIAEH